MVVTQCARTPRVATCVSARWDMMVTHHSPGAGILNSVHVVRLFVGRLFSARILLVVMSASVRKGLKL